MNDAEFSSFLSGVTKGSCVTPVVKAGGPRRRAVIVGLNYGWVQPGWQIPFLKGGVVDALRMHQVLRMYYGFEDHEIDLLVDCNGEGTEPTRENVLASLRWLTASTAPGDSLVFYYAGHSAGVYAGKNAFKENTLAALCVLDGMVFTYEIWALTSQLPAGCMITCMIDAPYGQFILNMPSVTPAEQPFTFAEDPRKPLPGMRFLSARQPPHGLPLPNLVHSSLPSGVNGFILCACGMRDVARELRAGLDGNSEPGGLFTLALCETLATIAGQTCTVAGVYEMVRQRMLSKAVQETSGLQCPSLCWSPNCPPEQVSFILPPNAMRVNRNGKYVNLEDGHAPSHGRLCCPPKSDRRRRSSSGY